MTRTTFVKSHMRKQDLSIESKERWENRNLPIIGIPAKPEAQFVGDHNRGKAEGWYRFEEEDGIDFSLYKKNKQKLNINLENNQENGWDVFIYAEGGRKGETISRGKTLNQALDIAVKYMRQHK